MAQFLYSRGLCTRYSRIGREISTMQENKTSISFILALAIAGVAYVTYQQRLELKSLGGSIDSLDKRISQIGSQATPAPPQAPPEIKWVSWTEGREQAIVTHRPTLLYFSKGQSCEKCVRLALETFPDPRVAEAMNKFVCIPFNLANTAEQDTAENQKALRAYGVNRAEGLPQLVFLLPGWSGEHVGEYKALGDSIPVDPSVFANFLGERYREVTQ